MTPRLIGPYLLDSILGQGASGVVYDAIGPQGPVALKVLTSGSSLERFLREGEVRIDHPNVVRVVGSGVSDEGDSFIAFERLDGEPLSAILERGPLPASEAVAIGLQICGGLGAVHAAGVLHRDLKPSNLFRCRDGRIKLLDFGIARIDSDASLTRTGQVIGTPAYMSPEQARGESALDTRTDLWSLGAVLYHVLAGRPPFQRETGLATLVAVLMEEPPPLSSLTKDVPASLVRIIERALAKAREARWQDASTLASALARVDLEEAPRAPVQQAPKHEETRVVTLLLAEGAHGFETLTACIELQGGEVFPLIADKMLGVFGRKTWIGDEIERAVTAALRARASLERAAVVSGRAQLTDQEISGTLLRTAEEGCARGLLGIAIDSGSTRALSRRFDIVTVDGEFAEVRGWIGGEEPPRPFVGRELELAYLARGIDETFVRRRPVWMLISGAAGSGKTGFRQKAVQLMRNRAEGSGRGCSVFVGRAELHRAGSMLAIFAAALANAVFRSLARRRGDRWRALDNLSLVERQGAIARLTGDAMAPGPAADECAAFLGELLGVRMPESSALAAARLDPTLMIDRVRMALVDLFTGIAKQRPLCLVLEDLQWADAASLDLLEELADLLEGTTLIVMTARPELADLRPDLLRGREVVRLDLRGLDAAEVALLASSVAERPLDGALVDAIAAHTAGNPLFVEQVALELRDRGLLDSGRIVDLPLPLSVEGLVQARLDRVPAEGKELLKRASILGRPFSPGEVEALGAPASRETLEALRQRGFLVRSRLPDEHRFKAALVLEVTYRMISAVHRKQLHRLAAISLRSRSSVSSEEIASHYERGDLPAAAARRYVRACIRGARLGDMHTVLRCAERALASDLSRTNRFMMHMLSADALQFFGRTEEMSAQLDAALAHAESAVERARVLAERSWWLVRRGQTEAARAAASVAVEAARGSGRPRVRAVVLGRRVAALIAAGCFEEARPILAEATALAESGSVHMRGLAASWRGQLAAARGDLGERFEAFSAAADLYRQAGDVRRSAGAQVNRADVFNRVGLYRDAEQALREVLSDCSRIGHRRMEGYAHANLGYALSMLGRREEAIAALDHAGAIAESTQEARLEIMVRVYRMRIEIDAVHGELGPDLAEQAERIAADARAIGQRNHEVVALALAARGRLAHGDLDSALSLSLAALEVRDELGGVEEDEGEVFLARARVLQACGRSAEAHALIETARRRLAEVAAGIADPRLSHAFLHEVAAHRALLSWEGSEPGET